jgi:hypothetical protein
MQSKMVCPLPILQSSFGSYLAERRCMLFALRSGTATGREWGSGDPLTINPSGKRMRSAPGYPAWRPREAVDLLWVQIFAANAGLTENRRSGFCGRVQIKGNLNFDLISTSHWN